MKPIFRRLIFFGMFFSAATAPALEASLLPSVGHNLSVTADLFPAGLCSVGFQFAACGVTPTFSMGFSPWILKDYRTANFGVRFAIDESNPDVKWTAQINAFKSLDPAREPLSGNFDSPEGAYDPPSRPGSYQMEAYWLMLVKTEQLSPSYRLHTNFQLDYYVNETMPVSLRRPSLTKSPFQVNITTLHEMSLVSDWFIMGELGLMDLNRDPIRLQAGSSIGRNGVSWSWHMGFSITSTYQGLFDPLSREDYQQVLRMYSWRGYDQELDPEAVRRDFAIHPEFSAQYFF